MGRGGAGRHCRPNPMAIPLRLAPARRALGGAQQGRPAAQLVRRFRLASCLFHHGTLVLGYRHAWVPLNCICREEVAAHQHRAAAENGHYDREPRLASCAQSLTTLTLIPHSAHDTVRCDRHCQHLAKSAITLMLPLYAAFTQDTIHTCSLVHFTFDTQTVYAAGGVRTKGSGAS